MEKHKSSLNRFPNTQNFSSVLTDALFLLQFFTQVNFS